MGLHFGNLYKLRGIVYFRVSPHELKPFAGMLSEGIPNMGRRINDCILRFMPQVGATYLLYSWANEEFARLERKDPKLYENDS